MTEIQQRTMSREDAEIFHGLDDRTVAYLRARITENPAIKSTLRRAALLRATQPSAPPKRKPTFLYLMQMGDDGPVKIGVAVDVEARRRTLSTAAPRPLRVICALPDSAHREREIHERFGYFRMNGEWFEPIPEIFDWFRMEAI